MRIGVFGGTFDPVHLAHLILAEQCREQAALDQILFIPAARPPHKQDQDIASFDRRVEMLALALAGNPAFRVDELEKNRAGPSYTVDTLTELKSRQPEAQLFLIVGSDTLHELATWRQPERILELAKLLVVTRPGFPMLDCEPLRQALNLSRPIEVQPILSPLIDIASREIRRRVATGQSIRYLVPRSVEMYIKEKGLYEKGSKA